MNNRRKLVIALGAGALAVPFAALAQVQQPKRVGYLMEIDEFISYLLPAFNAGMRELGYIEGKDYSVEIRAAGGNATRLPQLAQELVASKVDILLSSGTPSAIALQKATREIPILTTTAGDPVGTGLAAALNRPGGNVTGLSGQTTDLLTKRLDLMRQIVPQLKRVALLYDPGNASNIDGLKQFEVDCAKLGFIAIRATLSKKDELPSVFDSLKRDKAHALIAANPSSFIARRDAIIEQAARIRLPVIYGRDHFVAAGGLISYAPNSSDIYRRAAAYADKIFKGAKPADLPIEQPTKFDLAINMKTAKALGIGIPPSLLVQATKVIE